MKQATFAFVFLAFACAFGTHQDGRLGARHFPRTIQPGPKVVGGYDATPGLFPHQVSIQLENNASTVHVHNCGGSILNEYWILTAAHCIVGPDNYEEYLLVVAGEHDLNNVEGTEQNIEVEQIIMHPQYIVTPNLVAAYDLALLKLVSPLTLNERVVAIALPEKDAIPEGDSILSGWGSTGGILPGHKPSILQAADLPIVEYSVCEALYEGGPLEPTNMCTGPLEGGLSACSGDSGGPLIQRSDVDGDLLIGVVSWGVIPCGSPNAPSVYTRVSAFIDWINANMD